MRLKKVLVILMVGAMINVVSGCAMNAEIEQNVETEQNAEIEQNAEAEQNAEIEHHVEMERPTEVEKTDDGENIAFFNIPDDWGYQFSAPVIGSFKGFIKDEADAVDMEDGMSYGFDDRLAQGCSDWCGCYEFYSTAEASSSLTKQGEVSYDVSNLTTQTRSEVWAEGVDGDGVGETIEIKQLYSGTGDDIFLFDSICIVNGYAESEKQWEENNRVKSLKIYYEDEYMGTVTLEDTMKPQYIDVTPVKMSVGNGDEAKFKFEITDVYKGTLYEDTCITGILIDFEGKHAH